MRLAMFAVTRPVAGAEQQIGGLAQTGTGAMRIGGLQGEELAGQSTMPGANWCFRAQGAQCGNLRLEEIVVRQLEAKRDRACGRGAIHHVEPNDFVTALDEEMFAIRCAQYSHMGRVRDEEAVAWIVRQRGPRGQDTRVHRRRPHRQDMGAAMVRVLSESAAPSV